MKAEIIMCGYYADVLDRCDLCPVYLNCIMSNNPMSDKKFATAGREWARQEREKVE